MNSPRGPLPPPSPTSLSRGGARGRVTGSWGSRSQANWIGVGGRCSPLPVYALVKFSSCSQRCVTEGVDQFSDGDVVPDGLRCLQAHA